MAVEAQRLISVSLGKIASARSRRTGVDLHKNLLVSTVLQRAKNVFIIETYKATVQAKCEAAKVEKQTVSRPEPPSETRQVQACQESQPEVTPNNTADFVSENKENEPAKANENDKENQRMDCSDKLQEKSSNCDNIRPSCEVLEPKKLTQSDYNERVSCGGCVKRRHSDNEETDATTSKRTKLDNSSTGSKKSQGHNESQISSLVTIFNSGFSGLVNVGNQNSRQGYSESPATNSCATAVANSFDKFARPIIAMAMTV